MFPKVDGELETPIFGEPVLINKTTGIEVDLSLNSAKNWLIALEPYFDEREELSYVSKQYEITIFKKNVGIVWQ